MPTGDFGSLMSHVLTKIQIKHIGTFSDIINVVMHCKHKGLMSSQNKV